MIASIVIITMLERLPCLNFMSSSFGMLWPILLDTLNQEE